MSFSDIRDVLEEFRSGRPLILVGDERSTDDGHLLLAAEAATPESIDLMIRYGPGCLGIGLFADQLETLGLPATRSTDDLPMPFLSLNGKGRAAAASMSSEDRTALIRDLADPGRRTEKAMIPPWIVPVRAVWGGVLARVTAIESAVDLARLAGLRAAGVVCRLSLSALSASGLEDFAARHRLRIIHLPGLIAERRRRAEVSLVPLATPVRLPTEFGAFDAKVYEDPFTGYQHLALVMGEVDNGRPSLSRVHSECLTGDALGSLRCDCGPQLQLAMKRIAEAGQGVLIYLRQEGRGIGLYNKLRAYALQEQGYDTVEANVRLGFPADLRDYSVAAEILEDLGVSEIRLMTNNPKKIHSLESYGVKVRERVPLIVSASEENRFYLSTKQKKLGHLLGHEDAFKV